MRKLAIWYLERKLEKIKHEIKSVKNNQNIHEAEEVYNILKIKEKAFVDVIAMLKKHEY